MSDLPVILQPCQGVWKKRLDFAAQLPKLCSAVTITGCDVTVRLLGVSSLNLGCGQSAAHFFACFEPGGSRRVEFSVASNQGIGPDVGQPRNLAIDRRKIGPGRIEQLLEVVYDEIGLLEVVDAVAGAHHPPQVETNPVRPGIIETID